MKKIIVAFVAAIVAINFVACAGDGIYIPLPGPSGYEQCTSNDDCHETEACSAAGVCVMSECKSAWDCGEGENCNTDFFVCEEAMECSNTRECLILGSEYKCRFGLCRNF